MNLRKYKSNYDELKDEIGGLVGNLREARDQLECERNQNTDNLEKMASLQDTVDNLNAVVGPLESQVGFQKETINKLSEDLKEEKQSAREVIAHLEARAENNVQDALTSIAELKIKLRQLEDAKLELSRQNQSMKREERRQRHSLRTAEKSELIVNVSI